MPLVSKTLEMKIESIAKDAFKNAMIKYKDETSKITGNDGKDVFSTANSAASAEFAKGMKKIATEIDLYIKSATIIIPPGQVVATAGSPAAQTGATTAPSPPATIT
jgi:hypothetical protein